MIEVRLARRNDVPALLDIFARDTEGGHAESRDPAPLAVYEAAFDRIAASADNALYVAEWDGRVVGTFQLTFIPSLIGKARIRAKLESVHVHADVRSRGIGRVMLEAAIGLARARGAGLMELSSNKARKAAHRFYLRHGFANSHEGFKLGL
jgi:GNAT superfamily N-acetyltransferase